MDPKQTMAQIAALAAHLPHGQVSLNLGVSDDAVAVLVEQGARRKVTLYRGHDGEADFAIEFAALTVNGLDIRAQCSDRPLTDAERAILAEKGRERQPSRACTVEAGSAA